MKLSKENEITTNKSSGSSKSLRPNGKLNKVLNSYQENGISKGCISVQEASEICSCNDSSARGKMRDTMQSAVIDSKGTISIGKVSVPKGTDSKDWMIIIWFLNNL